MAVIYPPRFLTQQFSQLNDFYRLKESTALQTLLVKACVDRVRQQHILNYARRLIQHLRERLSHQHGIDGLLHEYDLCNEEGVLLMCLAEALLRIPDEATRIRFIREKLSVGHWERHLSSERSLLVNASAWGLLISGKYIDISSCENVVQRLIGRVGDQVLQLAVTQAMNILANSFVMGSDIHQALKRAGSHASSTRYSFDCLGEAAQNDEDVERYFEAYQQAIQAISVSNTLTSDVFASDGISVKLSALHPRYEVAKVERVMSEVLPRLRTLCERAMQGNISLTIDAEEADRLVLTLELFSALRSDPKFNDWHGLGLAVQAYQKRAYPLLQWLLEFAQEHKTVIPLRLVKGAYWDSEIKWAQEQGFNDYPVFTRKSSTDVSFLACARFLLEHSDYFYPQFATHNAYSAAYILEIAKADQSFEFQRLHGMGKDLYAMPSSTNDRPIPCRVYAPVGSHETLLPYLVRRLLENGANSSFVNQLGDQHRSIEQLIQDPIEKTKAVKATPHPKIPPPPMLYQPDRLNSSGYDLSDREVITSLQLVFDVTAAKTWLAQPLIAGERIKGDAYPVISPSHQHHVVGHVIKADDEQACHAMAVASEAIEQWDSLGGESRAKLLDKAAKLIESHAFELAYLIVSEGGRTVRDALNEVREAVDACRYYAVQARGLFKHSNLLPGPTGEENRLSLHGRGVFVCISPWNFPLTLFCGQVAAALVAGNSVVAKPASATPLTAMRCVELFHEAGVPAQVLHLLPGDAATLSPALLESPHLGGVAFTGSTETAQTIQKKLSNRSGAILPLIAETGGLNAMIVDSSALLEQVVTDVINSAFNSAGQRCSALRILYVQEEIADELIKRLSGAMEQLQMGDPVELATDIGPLIDAKAVKTIEQHTQQLTKKAKLLKALPLPESTNVGSFFPPHLFELTSADLLIKEVFGPCLHLVRFSHDRLDSVIDTINASGYGLTLGVHSRLETTWRRVEQRAKVGNLYINRNIIGAMIGVQPFGGEGLSGTGPKAGGPNYLPRFAIERSVSINTTASGGNASLLTIEDDPE